jgi:hypothetical protein
MQAARKIRPVSEMEAADGTAPCGGRRWRHWPAAKTPLSVLATSPAGAVYGAFDYGTVGE